MTHLCLDMGCICEARTLGCSPGLRSCQVAHRLFSRPLGAIASFALQVGLLEKLMWTMAALGVYLVCSQLPLYGIGMAKNRCVASFALQGHSVLWSLFQSGAALATPTCWRYAAPGAVNSTKLLPTSSRPLQLLID